MCGKISEVLDLDLLGSSALLVLGFCGEELGVDVGDDTSLGDDDYKRNERKDNKYIKKMTHHVRGACLIPHRYGWPIASDEERYL